MYFVEKLYGKQSFAVILLKHLKRLNLTFTKFYGETKLNDNQDRIFFLSAEYL